MKKTVYLDYAAATPVAEEVLAAMRPYFSENFYNPSALYLAAKDIKSAVINARTSVAKKLGVKSEEITFTAGGTESNNLAISGVMDKYPEANVVVSAVEHESVLEPAKKYESKLAPVDKYGVLDLGELEKLIDDNTVLVSVMYANNEVGAIQPISEVAKLIKKIRDNRAKNPDIKSNLPIYLHTDACQAANYLPLICNTLGVDLMTLNGGKIYGPKQSGILYVKSGVILQPQILGGGQEHGLRSGTENVAADIGFAAALDKVQKARDTESSRLAKLQQDFIKKLSVKIPKAVINGPKHRLPNNIHITFPRTDNERLIMELDEKGVMCAAGSACSAAKGTPSHVLAAMGLSNDDARASLRLTLGANTTQSDMDYVLKCLQDLVDA